MAAAGAHTGIYPAIGAAEAPGHDAPPGDEAVDFDPEVAAIFTDEATELIDAAERALSEWRSQPNSADFLRESQATVHTLKGGARMRASRPWRSLPRARDARHVGRQWRGHADVAVFDVIQGEPGRAPRMREQVITVGP